MSSDGLIRLDDREKVFNTIMLHHNYELHQGAFNFDLKKTHGSNQSLTSNKSDAGSRRLHIKQALRRDSSSAKKFTRRGSNAVFHPSRTGSFSSRREEVSRSGRSESDGWDDLLIQINEKAFEREYLFSF